jgi:plastocyanin
MVVGKGSRPSVVGTKLRTEFLLKQQSASLTFNDEGVFNYHCALHPNMKGSIEVKK